jgi:hypothetical protein
MSVEGLRGELGSACATSAALCVCSSELMQSSVTVWSCRVSAPAIRASAACSKRLRRRRAAGRACGSAVGRCSLRFVMHLGAAPEAGAGIGIDAVKDLDAGHGQRFRIRPHAQHRHFVVRFEAEFALRCVRQGGAAFEIVIEPQRHGDGDLGREAVIHVRRPTVARGLVFDERVGAIHVVHPAVEIVRGAAMQNRALDARRVALEAQRALEDLDVALDLLLLRLAAEVTRGCQRQP